MKPGMRVIQKQQVGDRWIWLASDNCEWVTYTSNSPDTSGTEHGHYFANYNNAVTDFKARVAAYE